MTGTLINTAAVLLGGTLGLLFGARLTERYRETIIAVLGLFTLAVGAMMFIEGAQFPGERIVIPLLSLLIAGFLGEFWQIEDRLTALGAKVEDRFASGSGDVSMSNPFIRGLITASLLFCIGPMTILGPLQEGLTGDFELLVIKSVLDGFAGMALASAFGFGVLFASIPVLIIQGGLTLFAAYLQPLASDVMVAEISVVGGVLLIALALSSLLEVKTIRTANLLPAIILAPILVLLSGSI